MNPIQDKVAFIRKNFSDDLSSEEQVDLLWKVIEACHAPITVTDHTDPKEPIIYCNRAFEDLTGYTYEEIVGKNCRFLQGEETDSDQINNIRTALSKNEPAEVALVNYRKDGTKFWNNLILHPVGTDERITNFIGMQILLSDRPTE
ncbi:PAS domain-containing protein [Candidatus Pacebacteria bacterium]|nr:PAS domain-containing protein [Candidatus Paceibacterota bacterium]